MSDSTAAPSTSARIAAITPAPTDAEVAAIVASVEALWPKPVMVADAAPERSTAWRFSGRWWSRPIAARRDRPYH